MEQTAMKESFQPVQDLVTVWDALGTDKYALGVAKQESENYFLVTWLNNTQEVTHKGNVVIVDRFTFHYKVYNIYMWRKDGYTRVPVNKRTRFRISNSRCAEYLRAGKKVDLCRRVDGKGWLLLSRIHHDPVVWEYRKADAQALIVYRYYTRNNHYKNYHARVVMVDDKQGYTFRSVFV